MEEITKPTQTVMIDPNEPLILPDGTALTGRIEWFLYSLCLLDYENLPTPMSRIEEFANALVTGEVPNIEPQSRVEEYFLAILTGDVENLPEPESRVEVLLNKLARGEFDLSDVEPIQSRYELLIAYLIKNSGIGDITYVLHEFLGSDTPYTMYNTKEKPTKSAILSGKTIKNMITSDFPITTGFKDFTLESAPINGIVYTFLIDVENNGGTFDFGVINTQGTSFSLLTPPISGSGILKFELTMGGGASNRLRFRKLSGNSNVTINCFTMIEGSYPYLTKPFIGLQSVKMPVLTTVGKNLWDNEQAIMKNSIGTVVSKIANGFKFVVDNNATGWQSNLKCNVAVKPNTDYTLTFTKTVYTDSYTNPKWGTGYVFISGVTSSNTLMEGSSGNNGTKSISFNSRNNTKIVIRIDSITDLNPLAGEFDITNLQLEEGSTATSYEPHKSNILTVNENVVLRGISDVQDTLDLLTGEVVGRIGEVVFDGSEDEIWSIPTNFSNGECKGYSLNVDNLTSILICDSLNILPNSQKYGTNEGVFASNGSIIIKKNLATRELLKEWLSQNPITVQYQLATESVKTVDLSILDQDGATVEKLNTFKDITHVSCSVDEGSIYPYVEMEVATSNDEDLAAIGLKLEEKNKVQSKLIKVNDYQSDVIDNVMLGITEIYESI